MRKRNLIIVAIILMAVGFAAITTNLIINGNTTVSNNKNDYDIRFTKAILEGTENNSLISNDGKEITYETSTLTNVGDKSELVYEISNNSSQYDAEVSISCVPTSTITHTSYYTINTTNTPETIKAKKSARGSIIVTLTQLSTESIKENFKCTLSINALERTSIGESCPYESGNEWTFDYKGSEDEFIVPCDGEYKLEVWGAQGGSYTEIYHGGYGGYSSGTIFLNRNNNIYVNVGGAGTFGNGSSNGGYNGGGSAMGAIDVANGSGGGATHIAKVSGILSTLSNNVDDILIVSGGGGGGCHWYNNSQTNYSYGRGGSGGGAIGGTGYTTYKLNSSSFGGNGIGGSQIAGGTGGTAKVSWGRGNSGSFGLGGDISSAASGGGGGYYGGGSGYDVGAGGGSGYIGNKLLTNKVMYCYSCTISDDESTKTESTTNVSESPVSEYAKMGNGYAKITYIGNGV